MFFDLLNLIACSVLIGGEKDQLCEIEKAQIFIYIPSS